MLKGERPGLFDSHCHLDLDAFDEDRVAVLGRAAAAGVEAIVLPAIELATLPSLLNLVVGKNGDGPALYAAVGVHPNSSDTWQADSGDTLRRFAQSPRVVAIGEIGLDYYWDKVPAAVQRAAFEAQLEIAAAVGLPVIIHSREANADVADVLEQWVVSEGFRRSPLAQRSYAGVLHAFSGDAALAERAYGWNFVLSLGGPVTYKNARGLHALVPHLRRDRLMLETDAPYLTPHPHRGQRNEPAYVALVCSQLAALYGVSVEEMAQASRQTARQFFGLDS
jgi:TatD DNase family protein